MNQNNFKRLITSGGLAVGSADSQSVGLRVGLALNLSSNFTKTIIWYKMHIRCSSVTLTYTLYDLATGSMARRSAPLFRQASLSMLDKSPSVLLKERLDRHGETTKTDKYMYRDQVIQKF